ncbi:MAG TPA: ribonuclease P protein component [Candidatus Paceibacterota bacterium]|nr:ribonuclease P protein component [Candidatus Paceibacterota bacterium]
MLSKKERFTRKQFEEFLSEKSARSVYNQLGTLKFVPSKEKRFSVVIASKAEKRATKRNALRRAIYSLFKKETQPISGILYVSKQATTLQKETIRECFNDLLKKIQKSSK